VQVNGRLRGKVKVAVGTGESVEKLAQADAVDCASPHRQSHRETHFRSGQIIGISSWRKGRWHDGERGQNRQTERAREQGGRMKAELGAWWFSIRRAV